MICIEITRYKSLQSLRTLRHNNGHINRSAWQQIRSPKATVSYGEQLWWGERLWMSLWSSRVKTPKLMDGHESIKMAIIVHRHGARLPNKCVSRDLSWPKNPEFYESYRGHLSPIGCEQLINVGLDLRERYVIGSDLFKGVPPHTLQQTVVAYTSNMQRTLFSAWSLLHGMFPDVPQYFSYASDRLKVNLRVSADVSSYDFRQTVSLFPEMGSR
jgi:hypothetical protein